MGEKVEDTTYEYEKAIVRLETYKAIMVKGHPVALEHADTKWVTRDEMKKLNFAPADVPAVVKICEEQ